MPEYRSRIISAAEALFYAHGFRKIPVDQVVAEIRISKATFYEIVPGKKDLLVMLVKRNLLRLEQHLGKTFGENRMSVGDKLARMAWQRSQYLSLMGVSFRRDLQLFEPDLFEHLTKGENEIHRKYIGKLIKRGREGGMFRTDLKHEFLLQLFLEVAAMPIRKETAIAFGYEGEGLYKRLFSVFLDGVIAPDYKPEQLELF